MLQFKEYIFEKVKKSEIKEIFKDNSILVGGEFEFFIDGLSTTGGEIGGMNIEELHDDWEDFYRELEDWVTRIEDEEQDLHNERENLERENERLERENDNLEDRIENDPEDADIIDKLELRVERNKKDIRDNEDRISEIEDEIMEVFDAVGEPPTPSSTLVDYAEEYWGMNLENLNYVEFLEDRSKFQELDRIEPSMEMFEPDEDAFLDNAEELLSRRLDFDFRVGQSPGAGDSWWGIVEDASVPMAEGGVEVISPPLPIPDFIDQAEEMLDFISEYGHTNSKTGLHINMSIKGINLKEELDVIKLFLFHDEDFVYKHFDERKGNLYVMSIKEKIKNAAFNPHDLEKIIKKDKLKNKVSQGGKYYGINLENISHTGSKQRIEYRYMGGNNYEDKWDNIKSMIGTYAYNLKLACDPNFKRKEYIKKINRVINKILEKDKPDYFFILLAKYMADNIFNEFTKRNIPMADVIRVVKSFNNYKNEMLKTKSIDISTAIKGFKNLEYSKSEYERFAHMLIDSIKGQVGRKSIPEELNDYMDKISKNPKLVKQGFSDEFKIRTKFFK